MHVDNNFPAPFQVMAFLGSAMLEGVLLLATIYGFVRGKDWTVKTLGVMALGIVLYGLVLAGFSAASHETTLARGEEKYFCEIDCHLAYAIVSTDAAFSNGASQLAVTVRTRFDEHTISPQRPKNASLAPSPRKVVLIDNAGQTYLPTRTLGTPMEKRLVPGDAYTTTLVFPVRDGRGMRLLITAPEGPVRLLIGNEMSFAHKKTYLGL